MSFGTAQWALDKATNIIEKKSSQLCGACKGTKRMKVYKDSTADCLHCKINGKPTGKITIGQLIGCKCEELSDSFWADDGHEIFGNDTYTCSNCGMVTQFG